MQNLTYILYQYINSLLIIFCDRHSKLCQHIESIDRSFLIDNLREFFFTSTFPFGIDAERICNRPDSIDSSLGGSSDMADDTCGNIPAEQSLSINKKINKNF